MEKYKFLDEITSDVMFEAYGKNLKEVFDNAATALFTIICHDVHGKNVIDVNVTGEDISDLMFNWLQELIARVDIEEMFFSKFEILEISETQLKAKIYGEPVSPEKGETVVKSLTYHQYKFEKTEKGFMTRVSCDI
jgi:SHS2 domain-containing protein